MHSIRLFICLVSAFGCALAQDRQVIPLWGDATPPFSKPNDVTEYEAPCWGAYCAYQVVDPTLTIYKPEGAGNGNIVLVLPGGGYDVVAVYHEGSQIAEGLAKRGTAAAVLKYRLPDPETSTRPGLVPLSDVHQATRMLRDPRDPFQLDAQRIGVMGFSAGAHLATAASLHRGEEKGLIPDFSMLIYGVTKLTPVNYQWLEQSLYHREMTAAEVIEQTFLERVDEHTPRAFLVHALDDDTCHYSESTLYAEALIRHGVEAEMHLFPHGGHGFGPGRAEDGTDQWLDLAANWLDRLK